MSFKIVLVPVARRMSDPEMLTGQPDQKHIDWFEQEEGLRSQEMNNLLALGYEVISATPLMDANAQWVVYGLHKADVSPVHRPYVLIHENNQEQMEMSMAEAYKLGYRLHSFHPSQSQWDCAVMTLQQPPTLPDPILPPTEPDADDTVVSPGTDAIII